jgi:hypothetical protein
LARWELAPTEKTFDGILNSTLILYGDFTTSMILFPAPKISKHDEIPSEIIICFASI